MEGNKSKIRFECLQPGKLFGYDGGLFVKTDSELISPNSFNFIDNLRYSLSASTPVKKLKGVLSNIEEDV